MAKSGAECQPAVTGHEVKAYRGSLPDGRFGIEFYTALRPDARGHPFNVRWSGGNLRPDVRTEHGWAKIACDIIKVSLPQVQSMKQLDAQKRWPSGCSWTVALLDRTVDQLRELGIAFDSGVEDLDSYRTAVLDDRYIGELRLFAGDHAPVPGVEIQVDAKISRDRGLSALRRQLGFGPESLTWITEEPKYIGFWPPKDWRSSDAEAAATDAKPRRVRQLSSDDDVIEESPNFRHPALAELAARGYRRKHSLPFA